MTVKINKFDRTRVDNGGPEGFCGAVLNAKWTLNLDLFVSYMLKEPGRGIVINYKAIYRR